MSVHAQMFHEEQVQDKPRTMTVPGRELNSLLAELAAHGAWVMSMEVKGAIYTLRIEWQAEAA